MLWTGVKWGFEKMLSVIGYPLSVISYLELQIKTH